jgi:hypothetical protein
VQPIKTAACLTPDVTCRSLHGRPYVTCSWSAASSASANSTWSNAICCTLRPWLSMCFIITGNASTCVNLCRQFWADCDSSMCLHIAWIVVPAVQMHMKLAQALTGSRPHFFQLLHRLIKKWNPWLPGFPRFYSGNLCSSMNRQSSLLYSFAGEQLESRELTQ